MTDLSAPPTRPLGALAASSLPGASEPELIEVVDPATGELVGRLPVATPEQTDQAVRTARAAAAGWARTPAGQRGAALAAMAAALRGRSRELAEVNTRETGRPTGEAEAGVLAGADTLDQYAQLGPVHRGRSLLGEWSATDLMVPEPRGVVVSLTPWNDPVAVACGLLGAALVTGNTVVHKPSERCPHLGLLLDRVLAEHLPEGVLTHLVGRGRTGARLAGNPDVDVIAHVGSTATGRSIAAAAARTGAKALLENGGNDPLLVDVDVDPEWAAQQAALGAFANVGQICTAVERVYVHRALAGPFLRALVAEADRRTGQRLAPLVDREHRDHVHSQVAEALSAGAVLGTGGVVPDGPGAHYPATVLTECRPDMRVMSEETFGPVAPVRVVDSFDQALAEAAADRYGLAATVLTGSMRNAQRAWRELPVGTVKVNAVFGGAPGGAAQPRAASGTGFGYGPELLDEMTTTKVVHLGQPVLG